MEFSEKLSKLLTLTQTQGTQLARDILVDPSQISRMRTGARGRPGNRETIRLMANFFAAHCGSEYRLSALAELTGDARIYTQPSEQMSADIIYEWLISDRKDVPGVHLDRMPQRIEHLSFENGESLQNAGSTGHTPAGNCAVYYDNVGKRQAVLALFEMVLQDDAPGDVYLFTDEDLDWTYEDPSYIDSLADCIRRLARHGCRFFRVEPHPQDMEASLLAIERWIPAYMSGAIRQYYYPRLRDELHRRTLFVAPGKGAVSSRSLFGQTQSRVTFFYTAQEMVDVCYEELQDILRLCRPMMHIYAAGDLDELYRRLERLAGTSASGIYKISSLSVPTLPPEVMKRICWQTGSVAAEKMMENHRRRSELRINVLKKNRLEDIITLADPAAVLAGEVIVPGTRLLPSGTIPYTPEEYLLHLQRIVEAMGTYENYHVMLNENPLWQDVTIYAKLDGSVLMIKEQDPCTIFDITENRLAASFCGYLKRIADYERARTDRQGTIRKLKDTIAALAAQL